MQQSSNWEAEHPISTTIHQAFGINQTMTLQIAWVLIPFLGFVRARAIPVDSHMGPIQYRLCPSAAHCHIKQPTVNLAHGCPKWESSGHTMIVLDKYTCTGPNTSSLFGLHSLTPAQTGQSKLKSTGRWWADGWTDRLMIWSCRGRRAKRSPTLTWDCIIIKKWLDLELTCARI